MRINCPYCGERDYQEFSYLGAASLKDRPDANAADAKETFFDYVYLRDNPAGANRELMHHQAGCRSWLIVTRDTRTHEILSVEMANAEVSA